MAAAPLISVNIPAYCQLPLARQAIASVLAQTFADFEINVVDDGASDEYQRYIEGLGDARVHYHRNPVRLGAMQNMFGAIHAGRGKYTMAFHEDDLMGRDYLRAAATIMEGHPRCGFVAGELREFREEPSVEQLSATWDPTRDLRAASAADYLKLIFSGVEPMFGSIVFRREAIQHVTPQHDAFATLVDRPYLLDVLRQWTAVVVRSPLVFYRHHGEGDRRHAPMRAEHILRLFETYREAWPAQWPAEDAGLFFKYSGWWLFELFRLTPPDGRIPLPSFIYKAWQRGVYRPTLRGHYGLWHLRRNVNIFARE